MRSIRSNCIETVVKDSGEFSHYRLTLPIPKDFPRTSNHFTMRGNKWFYIREHMAFDMIIDIKRDMQLKVTDYKIGLLAERRKNLVLKLTGS